MDRSVMTQGFDQTSQVPLTTLLQRVLALPLCLGTLATAVTFPVISFVLVAGLIVYALLLWRQPDAWLVALPTLLPLLELAPWSGRLLFDTFDMFAVMTVAASLWHGRFRTGNLPLSSRSTVFGFALLTAAWTISFVHGAWPLGPLDANALSGYYTHYNSFRVFKGFLWALLLAAPLGHALRADPQRARRLLWTGLASGILGVGLVVLWERGVIGAVLNGRGRYDILGALLDFTTSYRITALFSEMHTGGAQIDGYLALVWPFTLLPVLASQRWQDRAAGALAVGLGLYAILATFSRDVYGAFAVSSLTLLAGLLLPRRRWLTIGELTWLLVGLGVMSLVTVVDLKHGGTVAVASTALIFTVAAGLLAESGRLPTVTRVGIGAAAGLVSCFGAAYGMTTSKWVHNSASTAAVIAVATAAGASMAGIAFGVALQRVQRLNAWMLVILVAGTVAVGITAVTGYRMESRLSTVSKDAATRLSHWRDVLDAVPSTWTARLIGAGLGRFPYDFLVYTGDSDHVGTYAFHDTPGGPHYLSLGGGQDTRVGQRVALAPNTQYRISVRARGPNPGIPLRVAVCDKNLLFAVGHVCSYTTLKLNGPANAWQQTSNVINTGPVGRGAWYARWPVVLMLRNPVADTVVDVRNIALRDPQGKNLLANGDFRQGGDRWFSYNDHKHLQWHTKNMWLNVYFEQGLLGVTAVLTCVALALSRGAQRARRGDLYALVPIASICGFLTVGVFGSLFDAPRLTFLFMLVLFTLLLEPWQRAAPAGTGRTTGRMSVRHHNQTRSDAGHNSGH